MQTRNIRLIVFALLFLILKLPFVLAQAPETISYQGVLSTGNSSPVPDGTHELTFSIHTAAEGGTALWTETQSVPVINGIFNVILGKVNPLRISFDQPYRLAVRVNGGNELTPRIELTASPYSLHARSVADSSITTDKLADDAVTVEKMAPPIISSINGVSNDGGDIQLKAGSNVTITPNDGDNSITIGAEGGAFSGWSFNGNSGLSDQNFIGTLDFTPLIFKTNNQENMRIEEDGDARVKTRLQVWKDSTGIYLYPGDRDFATVGFIRQTPTSVIGETKINFHLDKTVILDDVKIGTSSFVPSNRLQVEALPTDVVNGTNGLLAFQNRNDFLLYHVLRLNSDLDTVWDTYTNAWGERLWFTRDGRFGIGRKPNPGNQFHVYNPDGDAIAQIQASQSGNNALLRFNRGGATPWEIGSVGSNFQINLGGNPAATLVISSTGEIGIGTSTPTQTLHVNGNVRADGYAQSGTGGETLRTIRGSVNTGGVRFVGSGFTATRVSTGEFEITFQTPFGDTPVVTANAISTLAAIVTVDATTASSTTIRIFDTNGAPLDRGFSVIAIGTP